MTRRLNLVPPASHPSPFELEAWLLAQDDDPGSPRPRVGHAPGDLLEIGDHVAGCADCQDQLDRLRDERSASLAALPRLDLDLGALPESAPEPVRRPLPWLAAAAALLAVGALIALRGPPPESGVRTKGGPEPLVVHVRAGDAWVPADRPIAAGDELRWGVRLAQGGFPLLVLREAGADVTVLYPRPDAAATPLPPDTPVLLDGGAQVDAVGPRDEFLLWSRAEPWTVRQLDAIRDGRLPTQQPDSTVPLQGATTP